MKKLCFEVLCLKVSAWEHGKAVPDEAETEKIRGME